MQALYEIQPELEAKRHRYLIDFGILLDYFLSGAQRHGAGTGRAKSCARRTDFWTRRHRLRSRFLSLRFFARRTAQFIGFHFIIVDSACFNARIAALQQREVSVFLDNQVKIRIHGAFARLTYSQFVNLSRHADYNDDNDNISDVEQ